MKKRFLAMLLTLIAAVALLTVGASAAEGDVAQVGGIKYATLAAAVDAAEAANASFDQYGDLPDAATVILLSDVEISEQITIEKPVKVDLAGRTLTCTAKDAFRVSADAIFVGGGMSTADGVVQGKIVNTNVSGRCINTRAAVTLKVEGITLQTTGAYNPQPLTIGGSAGGAKVTVLDTTIDAGKAGYGIISFVQTELSIQKSSITGYAALYMKEGSANSEITVNGSALTGKNESSYHESNSFATIVLEDDNISLDAFAGLGDCSIVAEDKNGSGQALLALGTASTGSITDAEVWFFDEVTLTTTGDDAGYLAAVDLDGNFVAFPVAYEAELEAEGYIMDNGIVVGYNAPINSEEALKDAIADAQNGDTITLADNITLTEGVIVPTGKTITIDLNGKTVTYNSTTQGEAMITNKGNLTINDTVGTGVINYNYTGAADSTYGKGNYTISNGGTLTVNGGKITIANLRAHAKYPIDNNSGTGNAVLVINGGHLYNYNTSAIRQFCNSTTYQNSVTINGGLIEGYSAIWMQNPGSHTVSGALTITGGEIRTTAAAYVGGTANLDEVASKIYCTIDGNGGAWSENSSVTITGGVFNENVYLAEESPASITIGEAAIFNGRAEIGTVCIGNAYYQTLADAIAAAQNGDTITLLVDVTVMPTQETPYVVLPDDVTLDLNGKNLIGNIDGLVAVNGGSLTTIDPRKPAEEQLMKMISADDTAFAYLSENGVFDISLDPKELTFVSGAVTLNQNWRTDTDQVVTIPNGASLVIPEGKTFEIQTGTKVVVGETAEVTINGTIIAAAKIGNNYYGDLATAAANVEGGKFTEGTFTVSPEAKYLAEGYAVQKQENGTIKVVPAEEVKAPEDVTVNTTPTVSAGTSTGSVELENVSPENQEVAETVAGEVAGAAGGAGIADASGSGAIENAVKELVADGDKNVQNVAASTLEAAGVIDTEDNVADEVYLHVETSLDITVTDVALDAGTVTSITVDITPVATVIASTAADADDVKLTGNEQNAVVISEKEEIKVTKPVTVSIPIPTALAQDGDTIFIVHTTDDGKKFVHEVTVTGGKATFENRNGFSLFSVYGASTPGGKVTYAYTGSVPAGAPALPSDTEPTIGSTVSVAAAPTMDGYTFSGWTTRDVDVTGGSFTMMDEDVLFTGSWSKIPPAYRITATKDENGAVSTDYKQARAGRLVTITVKAADKFVVKGVTVTTAAGKTVAVTDKGNGTYTFTMPSSAVTVAAEFGLPFTDIEAGHQFTPAIEWVYTNGLMIGMTETTFDRASNVSRQQVWMILARVTGADPENMAAAKAWAIEKGLTDGTQIPGEAVTREEFITMMWKVYGSPEADTAVLAKYSDADAISAEAKTAMAWATEVGITEGYGDGTMRPAATTTRGAFAAVLYRYLAK